MRKKNTGERWEIKEISTKSKIIQTKEDIPKPRILSTIGREWHENIPTTERFWTKIWQPKKHNENAESINNVTIELEEREEGPQNGNTHRLTPNNTEKNIKLESAWPWWNTWLLVQEIHLHSGQTSTRDEQMLTKRASTWMDDQRKDYISPKGTKQRNCSKQLPTDNLPNNDVENTNNTNKGEYLLLANKPRIVPWRTEMMPQRNQRHSRTTVHRSTYPKWEQDKTENSCYGLDWLQEGIWYGRTKLDTTLSENAQNITGNHKLNRTDHANLESGGESRRKKLNWNKDPKRHFPRRYTITLNIHNSHDAIYSENAQRDTNSADHKRRSIT